MDPILYRIGLQPIEKYALGLYILCVTMARIIR
jgi:hypothetical protein